MKKYVALLLLLTACNSAELLPPETVTEGLEEIEDIEDLSYIEEELAHWFAAWEPMIPDFSMADVKEVQSGLIKRDIFDAVSQEQLNAIMELEVELDMPLLFPSPDEEWALFVSANIEPDSEVALISLAEGAYERLLFCGTPCAWDGAGWLNTERFVVTGYMESDDAQSVTPTLHTFDLSNDTVTEYHGPAIETEAHR